MNLKEIIKHNKQHVQNIIKLITKESNEDLEQEVYVKVWKNFDKYCEKGSFKSWIGAIAKNVSKDYLKSSHCKYSQNSTADEEIIVSIKDKKSTPELKLLNKIRQKIIIYAIQNLKPKLKEAVILCEIEDFSYNEVSKKLKIPVGTVKSRLYNAKKELAEILKELL